MKKALVVGIDYYSNGSHLSGCVNDSVKVRDILKKNSDGTVNFDVRHLAAKGPESIVTRKVLKEGIIELFAGSDDIALLYFAGHGTLDNGPDSGLVTSDYTDAGDAVSFSLIMDIVDKSAVKNKIIVFDTCYSGKVAEESLCTQISKICVGTTILTSSTATQYSSEENGSGVFTTLFVDALNGAASNLLGEVSLGAIYAHIDKSLGPWEQRPTFKTNVKNFVSLRKVEPPIALSEIQKLPVLFPSSDFLFQLDPSFESERDSSSKSAVAIPPDAENVEKFKTLQKYRNCNLLVPVDAPHMWHAAMNSKSCKLTELGKYYRNLVAKNRI